MNRARRIPAPAPPARAPAAAAPDFRVDIARSWPEVAARWVRLAGRGAALPFQRETWLGCWYATQTGAAREPLLVTVRDGDTDVLALPLVLDRESRMRVVRFADAGLTDYNAPILGPGAPADTPGAQALWNAVARVLPQADMAEFEKMPLAVDGRPNPMALLPGTSASHVRGNVLFVPGPWEAWHRGLERRFRKELERSWRVFARHDGAAFHRLTGGPEAARAWRALKRMQAARFHERDLPYVLDRPANEAFYDRLVDHGLAQGRAVLTALAAGDEIVAALLGVSDGKHYAMVRLATAGERWANCSPGRLLIERTMRELHREGYRAFDFTIGDYDYKRRLGVEPVPLVDLRAALSWHGLPAVAVDGARQAVRRRRRVAALLRRLREGARRLLRGAGRTRN